MMKGGHGGQTNQLLGVHSTISGDDIHCFNGTLIHIIHTTIFTVQQQGREIMSEVDAILVY